jgi:hypothetical protein
MISIFSPPVESRYGTANKIALIGAWLFVIAGVLLIAYAGYVIAEQRYIKIPK